VIVLSAGMQKAGSAWFFNMTNDLMQAAGHADIRRLRPRYLLSPIMTRANCNMGTLPAIKLAWVSLPLLFGNSYVVKTHEAPTRTALFMIDRGLMRATYIYRDPRDVAVSLFRHGERIRREGIRSDTGFDRLESMEAAIRFASRRIPVWQAWRDSGRALMFRYEDLRAEPAAEVARLLDYLHLPLQQAEVSCVVERYWVGEGRRAPGVGGLHFDKGISGRWRKEMTAGEIDLCERLFGDRLVEMGYSRE
jgi:hypothetical protein